MGMKKKFYKLNSLISHMNQSHGKEIHMKFMYKLKIPDVAVGKAEDYQDGFQEILSFKEEEVKEELNGQVSDLGVALSNSKI